MTQFRTGLAAAAFAAAMSTAAAQDTKIIVQTAGQVPGMTTLFAVVADKAGFFKEEGLTYEVRFSAGGPIASQLIANNNSDFGLITYEPVMAGYGKGMRGKFINQFWSTLDYKIALLPESPITSAAELKGKNIGVPTMASNAVLIAKSILRSAGIDQNDVTFIPVGSESSAINALRQKRVDVYAGFTSGFAGMARFGQPLRYITHPTASGIGNGGYYASPRMLGQPKLAEGFLRAVTKAAVFIDTNPEASLRMFWEAFPNTKPQAATEQEAVAAGLTDLRETMAVFDIKAEEGKLIGQSDLRQVAAYADILRQEGFLTDTVPPENFVTNDFVKAANDFDAEAVRKRAREWPGT